MDTDITMNRRIATLQWVLGLLTAGSAVLLSVWARLPAPYRDDWVMLLWVLADQPPAAYFVPHNEHVIPLTRLVFAFQYQVEGSNGYTTLVIGVACIAVIAILTLLEIRRRWPDDGVMRQWVWGLALVVLPFAWQLQAIVFPTAVIFPLVEMFAVVALVCLLNATDHHRGRRPGWLAAAVLASLAASLTVTNGLAVPVMLAIVGLARRAGWKVVVGFLVMGALGGGAYLLIGLAGPVPSSLSLDHVQSPAAVLAFFLAFYSSLLAQANEAAGVVIGTLLFSAGLAAVIVTTVNGPGRPRIEHFAIGVLLFGMAAAALAAPTRAEFGIVQVAQSRYASLVLPFWTALILMGASRSSRQRVAGLFVPALAVSMAALAAHVGIGAVWIAKADNVATAGLAVRVGARDDEWTRTLYPEPEFLYRVLAQLESRGDRWLEAPLLRTSFDPDKSPECDGTMTVTPVPQGSGLRLRGETSVSVRVGAILDGAGRVVGLARPAPIASMPNPAPMDVARAVRRAIRSSSNRLVEWIGFATPGAGAPYTVLLLDAADAPICRATATTP